MGLGPLIGLDLFCRFLRGSFHCFLHTYEVVSTTPLGNRKSPSRPTDLRCFVTHAMTEARSLHDRQSVLGFPFRCAFPILDFIVFVS